MMLKSQLYLNFSEGNIMIGFCCTGKYAYNNIINSAEAGF